MSYAEITVWQVEILHFDPASYDMLKPYVNATAHVNRWDQTAADTVIAISNASRPAGPAEHR
jgi:hypothetical protein